MGGRDPPRARLSPVLSDLQSFEDVSGYPEPYGQNLRWLLRDYCRYEIKYAWPQYRKGIVPDGGDTRISAFKERLFAFQPQTKDD
jgi:hypothetical protein